MTLKENITANSSLNPNRYGMTLIELLIVLGILAALAGMTLSLVSELNSANRQDITRTKLNQIESAIIGDEKNTSKFLNDMGRLPVIIKGNEGEELSELWNKNLFKLAEDISIDDYKGYNNDLPNTISVTLNVGWKGPYLNVQNKLYDGFGNEIKVIEKDDNDTILKFGSLGNDDEGDKQDETTSENWQNTDDIREIPSSKVFSTLHVKIMVRDSSANQTTWLPPVKTSGFAKYVTGIHHYGDIVLPETGETLLISPAQENDLFLCINGESLASITNPTWSRSQIVKKATTDGSITYWRWLPYSDKLSNLRVIIFSPYVTKKENDNNVKTPDVRITTAHFDGSTHWLFDDQLNNSAELPNVSNQPTLDQPTETEPEQPTPIQENINEVTFTNLVPGIRKIFAYGYGDASLKSNFQRSSLQTIELKSGENFITIYLNEN